MGEFFQVRRGLLSLSVLSVSSVVPLLFLPQTEGFAVRVADILGLALAALWQQKVRTLLTTLGVVFGSFVLAASLSINQGVQDTIERESHRSDFLRKIQVRPDFLGTTPAVAPAEVTVKGAMTDARRERLRQVIQERQQRFSGHQT